MELKSRYRGNGGSKGGRCGYRHRIRKIQIITLLYVWIHKLEAAHIPNIWDLGLWKVQTYFCVATLNSCWLACPSKFSGGAHKVLPKPKFQGGLRVMGEGGQDSPEPPPSQTQLWEVSFFITCLGMASKLFLAQG